MPNPLDTLVPFKAGYDPRRGGGAWPGWRRALRKIVGEGEAYYKVLDELARGVTFVPVYPDDHPDEAKRGKQVEEPVIHQGYVTGRVPVVITVPPAVRKAAATELLDRAFGKPVQVVLDVTPDGDGQGEYVAASDLTPEETAIIRQIAKRRMLVQRVTQTVEGEVVNSEGGTDAG